MVKDDIKKKKMKEKILVIGDVMVDSYIGGSVNRINPEAPTLILEAEEETLSLGGAANVANNLISLGAEAYLIGYTGKDEAGKDFNRMAKDRGINIKLFESSITTLKKRYGYPQMLRVDWEDKVNVSDKEISEIILKIKEVEPSIIIISDYAKGCISQELFDKIVELNRALNFKIIVDPKPSSGINYKGCFLMTPNLKEAIEISKNNSLEYTGDYLVNKYECNVMITMGDDGISLFTKGKYTKLPTVAKEVYNVSGAGDAVIASMAFAISKGWELDKAMKFANSIAGEVVSTKRTSIKGNKKIVLTNGCFDILHAGHIEYLEKAGEMGYLIVGLNSDTSMERIKRKPQFSQEDRKTILEKLRFVDEVIIFDEDTPIKLINKINPDIYVKSKGYKDIDAIDESIRELVRDRLCIIPPSNNKSSSEIINKIKNG